jgi:STE24 endopeptidase
VGAGPRLTATLASAVLAGETALALLRPRAGVVNPLPVPATGYFSPEEISRARRYGRGQLAIGLAGGAARLALLVAAATRGSDLAIKHPSAFEPEVASSQGRKPPFGVVGNPRTARLQDLTPVVGAAVGGAALAVADVLAGLPFRALARRRALHVGLATDSWGAWARDRAKATAIGAGISAVGSAAGVALIRARPDDWWLPGAGLLVGTSVAGAVLAPVLLDPVFNDFTPLEGEPRDAVLGLAAQAGVSVGSVLSVDASRRTSAANAYVSGLGRTKRVVLFDTLLDRYPPPERDLVIAHELAHVRHRDVRRLLAFLALTAPPTAAFAQALAARLDPQGVGTGRATARSLPALSLALGAASALTMQASLRLSRRVENRADSYALTLSPDPDAFIDFERRIALQNLADPDPPRLLQLAFGTHPTIVQRIGIAEAVKQRRRRPAPRPDRAPRSPAGS